MLGKFGACAFCVHLLWLPCREEVSLQGLPKSLEAPLASPSFKQSAGLRLTQQGHARCLPQPAGFGVSHDKVCVS